MSRFALLLLTAFLTPVLLTADEGVRDPLFAKVKFDTWTAGSAQSPFKWKVQAQPIVLSNHQRWLAKVDVEIDGAEMESRRGRGALIVLFQFQDASGHLYQDHGYLDLTKVEAGIRSQIITYSESAFVLPGNYPMTVGIFDTNNQEHWLRNETLKVPQMKNEPLPFAWRDLPEIEFHPPEETPDSWYMPTVKGRLHLPVENRHPLKIDILVNLTPSEIASGSARIQDRNLSVLLPTMKALAQMNLKGGTLNVESIDLTRQKVTFRQEAVAKLDWTKMRAALTEDQLGTIDVKSLGERGSSVQFFENEVAKRVRTADVLIILSSSARFESGMDRTPLKTEGTPDCRVYYIRYHPPPVRYMVQPQATMLGRRVPLSRSQPMMQMGPTIVDQLEATLRNLRHRLFDVQNPEEMRKALAELTIDLSAM